jgi:cell division initiation protein
MRMTPLDVQSHRFRRRLSGYDPEEVDSFLRIVAEDYESLLRERGGLADRLRLLERRLEELTANEKLLQQTLVSAQAAADELRQAAVKESEVLLSEAEVKAEKLIVAAHRRAGQLAEEIRAMRGMRARIANGLRAAIQTYVSMIESLEAEPAEGALDESKIAVLTRGKPESGGS